MNKLLFAFFGILFAITSILTLPLSAPAYADPPQSVEQKSENNDSSNTETTTDQPESTETDDEGNLLDKFEKKLEDNYAEKHNNGVGTVCDDQSGAIGWLICPTTGAVAKASDAIYSIIEDILEINPNAVTTDSTVHVVWTYARDITNIVFIIFLLIVVISHLTGFGINNYSLKRILPRLIIVAILVNVSFIICQIAIDVSNILGSSIRGAFYSIEEQAIAQGVASTVNISWSDVINAITTTGVIASAGIIFTGGIDLGILFWALIPILLGAIASVIIGLITISLRQGLVIVLAMIAPLAFVCFLLPNTEGWFKKWKSLFMKMLIFYPMYSFLFGASHIAGWAIITSSVNAEGETSGFGVIVGLAVQIFPLFGSWSLMKMSGTILGTINQKLTGFTSKRLAGVYGAAAERKLYARQKYLNNSTSLGANFKRFADYRTKLMRTDGLNQKSIYDTNLQNRINKKMISGYNPNNAENVNLKANKYLRTAKRARISEMNTMTSTKDVGHVLDKYGEYYGKASATDARLGNKSAQSWLEFNRANFTQVADEEADFDYLVDEYIRMNELGPENAFYKRYINSVSPDGKFSVMGQLINKAAGVEARRRRDYNTMLAKWNFDKTNFRNMAVGYKVNDDGIALDVNGNKIEKQPGYLLSHDPSQLVLYDKQENGRAYFDWYDKDKFVMRVYRDDSAFMKEAFANFDTVINDPMNTLYGTLSGIESGQYIPPLQQELNETDEEYAVRLEEEKRRYSGIGLAKYSTTLGRATLSSGYKEKDAACGPYWAEMVKKRLIHTTGENNIARIDSFIKSAKAGTFLTGDQFSTRQYAYMFDPENFSTAFPDEDIMNYRNINGEGLKGLAEDCETTIPAEEATLEQKKRKFQQDLFLRAMYTMENMLTKITPNIKENMKQSQAEALSDLSNVFAKWVGLKDSESPLMPELIKTNPYRSKTSVSYEKIVQENKQRITQFNTDIDQDIGIASTELYRQIDEAKSASGDNKIAFLDTLATLLGSDRTYANITSQFIDYQTDHPDASVEELYNFLIELLVAYHF